MTSEIALKFVFFGLVALAVVLEVVGDVFSRNGLLIIKTFCFMLDS
ncbi:MAG: hypothetical protein KJ583_02615 [Nanoarchaeota archaeon]|nr:hypothetical protein [Nanoarchaeota archaeon]MBU1270272.1 hypothetical protein [Nanoarchaeota archaeon]MBU1604187.1 hypothetical protein [Nanoarchaeota archaeon]MBU2443095.1 hypothetical protein [Nanoarchaeota archaeon]